jgi:hypothetical protein
MTARLARPAVAALAAILVLLGIGLVTGLVTVDHWYGTYGVSIGTDTHYCSFELGLWPTCEHAQ